MSALLVFEHELYKLNEFIINYQGIMNVINKIHQIITGYEKKEAKGFEVWMVYWKAIRCNYWRDPVERSKSFIDKNDAEIFAKSLDEANALLQNDFEIKVRIVKQN